MEYSSNRTFKLISGTLISALLIGFLPWREIRADANTHGEYSSYPFEITYDQTSSWGNSTQGQFEITNVSGYDVTSLTLEIDYYDNVTLSNIWNVSDITDYSTDENIVITSDSTIAAGQTYTFGLIADGIESAPVAPVAVSVVAYESDEPVITPTPEITEVPTTTEEVIVTEDPIPTEELEPTVFPYAIFAASTTDDFTFQGWKSNITGDVYSGRDFLYQGSELYMEGFARTVGVVNPSGWITSMTGAEEGIEPVAIPDWSEAILAKAEVLQAIEPTVFESQDCIAANGYYYTEDDITISSAIFTGDVVIVAKGNITYNVDSLMPGEESEGRVLLYSEEGNITINGTEIEINGILYAPQGRVSINAYNTTINGRIVADKFSYSGSILNVTADPSDLQLVSDLPEVTVTASQAEVYAGNTAYYTIEIPTDNVFEILYRLNGTEVEVTIPETQEDPIRYYLDTSETGTYTLEAYVVLPYGEFVLDSDTIEVLEPTDTPTPTDEPTTTPTVTSIPTVTDTPVPTEEPTNTPTEEPTTIPTVTVLPTQTPTITAVPTVEPTEIPTDSPTPTAVPTELVINTNTPTPTVTPEPTGTEPEVPFAEKYAIYSQGDPQYNYQEYFVPDQWVHGPDTCGVVTQTYIAAKSQILWSDARVSSAFYKEFSPDYSFTLRFTYSNPLCLGNADLIKIKNSTGQSLDIQIDISKSGGAHYWKDQYGQGEWQYGNEPYNSMIGINLNGDGMRDYAIAEYLPFLDRNSVHEIWLEYDGKEEILYVYVATYDENGEVTKPSSPTLMLNISLAELFENDHRMYLETDLEMGVHSTWTYIYVFGFEFDPYPEIHKEATEDIEILGSLEEDYYEVGDTISIVGRVSPDIDVDTATISVLDEDGNEVYQNPIDIAATYDEIARLDTTGWEPGEYTLEISVTEKDGEEHVKEVTITLSPEAIYLELEKAVLDDGVIYIYGTVEFSEDGTYELRYFDFEDSLWKPIVIDAEETTGVLGELDFELNPYGNIFVDLIAVSDSGARKSLSGEFLLETTTPTPTITPTVTPTPSGDYTVEELFADIEDSQDGQDITFITDIIGTVSGTELQSYTFEVFPADSEEAVYTYTGISPVDNAAVGQIDPTLLMNGYYKVVLTAYADDGYVWDEVIVLVKDQAKVGNFTISFLDMTLPVAGLPVEVYRTYDSRQRTQLGDFGYGWDLSIGGPDISISTNLGEDWGTEMQMVLAVPMYYWSEVHPHEVYVDWGNGHEEVFKLVLSPESTLSFDNWVGISATFQNTSGTGDTLEILDGSDNLIYADNSLYTSGLQKFDPQNFLLTRYDGMKFYFNKVSGLYKIEDTYGRTIEITEEGVVYSDGSSINFVRNEQGLITSITNGTYTVTYTYDESGNLVSVVDKSGNNSSFTYEDHLLIGMINAAGTCVSTNEYDDDGRLISTTDAYGNTITFDHDIDGQIETVTNRLGYTTVYTYDEKGNVLTVTDALGNTTSYTYDIAGNLTTITDAMSNETTYAYDGYGRIVSETNALGQTASITYNSNGQIATATDFAGNTIAYSYDSIGRVTAAVWGDQELSYTYDSYGNVLSAGNVSYTYNGNGLLSSKTDGQGNEIDYSYNSVYLLSGITTDDMSVSYGYDKYGRLESVTDGEGQVTTYTYDDVGNVQTVSYPNGVVTTYGYDSTNLIISIYTVNAAGDVLQDYSYTRDLNGNIVEADEGDRTVYYEYDALGRLTKETVEDSSGTHVTEYTYDANSNRLSKSVDGVVTSYTYNEINQLVQAGSVTYTYDASGNLVSQSVNGTLVVAYEYDEFNRLISVTGYAAGNEYDASFTYDDDGSRKSKTFNGTTTYYITDSSSGYSQVLKSITGGETTYYVRGFDLISSSDGTDTYYYLTDVAGSIRCLTDESGNVTDAYVFDSFGNITESTGSTDNSYGFQGEEQDETGLIYLRARYMDPETGRFLSMDSYGGNLSNPISQNRYLFANSNPIRYSDSSGHFSLAEMDTAMAINYVIDSAMYSCMAYCLDTWITDPNCENHSFLGCLGATLFGVVIAVVFGAAMLFPLSQIVAGIGIAILGGLGIAKGVIDIINGYGLYGSLEILLGIYGIYTGIGIAKVGLGNYKASNASDNDYSGSSYQNPSNPNQGNPKELSNDEIKQLINNADRTGSALNKTDPYHRAASFPPDGEWSVFSFMNKNNEEFTAYQIDTTVNGVNGVFEYIMDSTGTITHQQFAPNVFADGVPHTFNIQ